jgi:hypothetical protein
VIIVKKFISGLLVGVLVTAGISVGAEAVKQYVAKEVSYPILINGNMFFTDKPIVSINDTTYMPLAAIGKALGVRVSWNSEKKMVEIGETDNTEDYSDWMPYSRPDPE